MGGTLRYELSLLVIQQGGAWTAQCLEYDLAAQGSTPDEAQRAFEQLFTGQVLLDIQHGRLPLQGIRPAPHEFAMRFERAQTRSAPKRDFSMPRGIPAPFIIQAAEKDVRCA